MILYYVRISMGLEGAAMLVSVSFAAGVVAASIARWWRA